MKDEVFTVDLQVAAVLLCFSSQNEVICGFDLEVFSLILVLDEEKHMETYGGDFSGRRHNMTDQLNLNRCSLCP